MKRSLLGVGEGSKAAPCGSFSWFLVVWDTHISCCVPWWGWHSSLCHKFWDFQRPDCPNVTSPFPTAILSFVHCCLHHLVCEQCPVPDKAVFSQTPPQQHLTTLEKSSVDVALTELLSAEFGVAGGEDLSIFAPLKEPSLLITGGAWLRAPPLQTCAVARSLCSAWEIVTGILTCAAASARCKKKKNNKKNQDKWHLKS